MPFTDTAKNEMLDAADIVSVSAHTADPGTTGASEVTGGSYARQTITYAAASGGSRAASDQPAIPIPGGTTVTHLGFWATNGTTFKGSVDITDEAFGGDGTLTVTSSTLTI